MFKYFTEFYKQGVYHFLVSAVCAALFALGLEYSQGSNGDHGTPYFVSAMVLSAFHFFLTITALLACYFARSLSDIYDTLRRWDNSEKHFRRLKALYLLVNYPCFLWGIVGAALTGNSGICSNAENPCYYTVNKGENRAIAIVIIVIHIFNVAVSFITVTTTHKIRREQDTDPTVLRNKSKVPETLALSLKTPNFNARNKNDQKKDNKGAPQAKEEPQPLKRHISSISNGPKFHKDDTNKRDILPPLKQPVKRHHTVHEGPIRLADDTSIKRRGKIENEPDASTIQSNKSDKKIRRLISKVSIVAPKNRNASFVKPKNKALYNESDDSSTSSDDSDKKKTRKDKKHAISVRRMSERPNVPPPSYNQVIESSIEPYWIPPPPENDSSSYYLPENMYTGYSYPDTELVPAQPIEVPKAQWQIK